MESVFPTKLGLNINSQLSSTGSIVADDRISLNFNMLPLLSPILKESALEKWIPSISDSLCAYC
jgi:hypothetical protein